MQDSDVVAAIVAGDPEGLAEAYDRYAAPLYAWCRLMLPAPDAAGAVQDTFVVATARLEGLHDPAMLGPWLHAVARNECLRRPATPPQPAGAPPQPAAAAPPQPAAVPAQPAGGVRVVAEPPAGLREQVLAACTDSTPAGRAYRVGVAYRAGAFGRGGFPKPIGSYGPRWWRGLRRHPRTAVAVGTAVVMAAVAAGVVPALAFGGRPQARAATFALGAPKVPAGKADASPAEPALNARHNARHSARPARSAGKASRGRRPVTAQAAPGTAALASRPAQSPPAPAPPPATGPAPAPPPSQGSLVAVPDQLILLPAKGKTQGTFVLTAVNGPVGNFVITVSPDAAGRIEVSPPAGSLPADGQAQVTVTVSGKAALDTYLTVNPGNITIEVELIKA